MRQKDAWTLVIVYNSINCHGVHNARWHYFLNTYIQTLHLCECVLHSLIYILRRRENKKYSAVQYTTEKFLAASFCAVTDLKH